MRVFNVEIHGIDAEKFCNLSKKDKYDWILANTNQTNDKLINDFLKRTLDPNKKEHCVECAAKKQKITISKIVENGNISSRDEQTTETIVEPSETGTVSRSRNKKK